MKTDQPALFEPVANTGTATISPDGRYRYTLGRRIAPAHLGDMAHVLWVMLNPSTADDVKPDATITRCMGFTAGWGLGEMRVVNLFAFRATFPIELRRYAAGVDRSGGVDIVGPDNDFHLAAEAVRAADTSGARIVVAWGGCAELSRKADRVMLGARVRRVLTLLAPNDLWCLGFNKDGSPLHPLYVPGVRVLERWTPVVEVGRG